MTKHEENSAVSGVGSTDGLGDEARGIGWLLCHGLTGIAVGYLREDSTVVFECDVCNRRVRSEISRNDYLSPNLNWAAKVPHNLAPSPYNSA